MDNWEIYIRTIDNHCEFWSVKLNSNGTSSSVIKFGALGKSSGSLHDYKDVALVEAKRRDKLRNGYVYFGKRKYASPMSSELKSVSCQREI